MGSVRAQAQGAQAYAGEVTALEAWECLKSDAQAMLIDVRTPPEWAEGVADLSALSKESLPISWKLYPSYAINQRFVASLKAAGVKADAPVFFLCRSGGRSLDAAVAATAAGFAHCYNVTDGFENQGGWKSTALPWKKQ